MKKLNEHITKCESVPGSSAYAAPVSMAVYVEGMRIVKDAIDALEDSAHTDHDTAARIVALERIVEVEAQPPAERGCEGCAYEHESSSSCGHCDPDIFDMWQPKQAQEQGGDDIVKLLTEWAAQDGMKRDIYGHQTLTRAAKEISEMRELLHDLDVAGTGYSQQTLDAVTKEREELRAKLAAAEEHNIAQIAEAMALRNDAQMSCLWKYMERK